MPLGDNTGLKDKLIRRTTKINNKNNINIINKINKTSAKPDKATYGTLLQSFYIRQDLLKQLRSFAYWERLRITEAFNTVLRDGLRGKKIKTVITGKK